jgi:hypothetical protein
MKTPIAVLLLTLATSLTFLGLSPRAVSAQTAEDLVANALAARGGVEKMKAIRSQRVSGNISFGPGADGPFTVEFARPGKMHMDISIAGQTIVRVYDGQSAGWVINPFVTNKDVQPMGADDLRNISDESDFDGPLLDYQSKGNHIELAGKDQVDGKPVNLLKLTNKNGDARTYYFDASTNLLLKWVGKRKAENQELDVETFFRDYREVNGLKFAFEVDSDTPGTQLMQKITIQKIELDPDIDPLRFGKPPLPAPAAEAAPAAAPEPSPTPTPAPTPTPPPSTPPKP